MKLDFNSFSNKGSRQNNEDAVYPTISDIFSNLFIVCDGVGGAAKGEIASDLVKKNLVYELSKEKNYELNKTHIQKAIKKTEVKLAEYLKVNPESEGMATTLTIAYFNKNNVVLGHIGDSRIYQFRNGKMLFKTQDHSLVNDLLSSNIISYNESLNHPHKNIINRALVAGKNDIKADFETISDLANNDIFLLCSDGILESFNDAELAELFITDRKIETYTNEIVEKCKIHSNDNFSAIVIKITDIEAPKKSIWDRIFK